MYSKRLFASFSSSLLFLFEFAVVRGKSFFFSRTNSFSSTEGEKNRGSEKQVSQTLSLEKTRERSWSSSRTEKRRMPNPQKHDFLN